MWYLCNICRALPKVDSRPRRPGINKLMETPTASIIMNAEQESQRLSLTQADDPPRRKEKAENVAKGISIAVCRPDRKYKQYRAPAHAC